MRIILYTLILWAVLALVAIGIIWYAVQAI